MRRWNAWMRKAVPLFGAGLLLQAAGCSFNFGDIAQGVLTATAGNLISTYVFGAFNVPMSSFF